MLKELWKLFWIFAKMGVTPFADLVSACCEPTKEELAQERRSKSLLARVMRRLKR